MIQIASMRFLALIESNDILKLRQGVNLTQVQLFLLLFLQNVFIIRLSWFWLHEKIDIPSNLKFILGPNAKFPALVFKHTRDLWVIVLGRKKDKRQLVPIFSWHLIDILIFFVFILVDKLLEANEVFQLIW